jgi:hypothetical protein
MLKQLLKVQMVLKLKHLPTTDLKDVHDNSWRKGLRLTSTFTPMTYNRHNPYWEELHPQEWKWTLPLFLNLVLVTSTSPKNCKRCTIYFEIVTKNYKWANKVGWPMMYSNIFFSINVIWRSKNTTNPFYSKVFKPHLPSHYGTSFHYGTKSDM